MDHIVTIGSSGSKGYALVIHPQKAHAIHLKRKKYAYLSFGTQKHIVRIKLKNEVPKDCIKISQKVIDHLHLPEYLKYELAVYHNEIMIGPYIGLLVSREDKMLTGGCLQEMMVFVQEYNQLHGAVVVFALDKVNKVRRTVEGYCYHAGKNLWQRGTFPYPSSIYRTIGIGVCWKNHFLSAIGDKMFHNSHLNKWNIFKWFSNKVRIRKSIPFTILFRTYQDFWDMLNRFEKIYVKPVFRLKGHGMVKVFKKDNAVVFKYRENGVNHSITLEDPHHIKDYINSCFNKGKFFLQQGIDLPLYNGGTIDFRCMAVKNKPKNWVCAGVMGRLSDRDSILHSISSGGVVLPPVDLLKKGMGLPEEDALCLVQRIQNFAIDICNQLDEYGFHCGILEIDIGIDVKGHLWLLEVNCRNPDPLVALEMWDEKLYHDVKTRLMFYAKSLAGFKKRKA